MMDDALYSVAIGNDHTARIAQAKRSFWMGSAGEIFSQKGARSTRRVEGRIEVGEERGVVSLGAREGCCTTARPRIFKAE